MGRQTPGCQAQNWPAASFLPGEAAQWAMEGCDVRRPHPFPGLWGLSWVIAAPSCPWVGRWPQPCQVGEGNLRVPQRWLNRGLHGPQKEASDSCATFQKPH